MIFTIWNKTFLIRNDKGKAILIPDLGDGLCWSSIAFSKKRFLSDTLFGVLAIAGGD